MRKINAFIFICFYLLMTKMVFAATVEIGGKQFNCDRTDEIYFSCGEGSKKFIVGYSSVGWGAFAIEGDGVVSVKPISKMTDGKVLFQSNNVKPYEDTVYNRKMAADEIAMIMGPRKDNVSKNLLSEARKFQAGFSDIIPKLTMTMNGSGDSYQCTKGDTRALTSKQISLQEKNNVVFTCPYYSCTGKDPSEKVLMVLPKPGNTYTGPSTLIMKNGQAKLVEGGYKITNGSSIPVVNFPKGYNSTQDDEDAPGLPAADVNPDLLIPSKYNDSRSSYKYLMNLAKKDFNDTGYMDLCTGPVMKDLADERKKIANGMLAYLSDAEIIEYLKVIDGSIHSYYVDRKKGEMLGCMYQNKIIDSSVLGQFDHLKDISTIKTGGKVLKPDEVQDLFKKAKNMKDIPFDYKYDGCYARAHIMSQRFEAMGIPTQKVWIKGKLFVPGTDIEWQYHVAPTVEVREKDGKIVNYVIDPSLTDKAVTIDEWIATMGRKAPGPVMKTTYPFPGNALDFQRTTVAISPDDVFGPEDIQGMSAQDKMDFSTQKLKEFSEVLASQGKK